MLYLKTPPTRAELVEADRRRRHRGARRRAQARGRSTPNSASPTPPTTNCSTPWPSIRSSSSGPSSPPPRAPGWPGRSTPSARFCDPLRSFAVATGRSGRHRRGGLRRPRPPTTSRSGRRPPTTTTTTTPSTETPVPLSAYLENIGVTGAPVAPDKLTDLTVSLPHPARLGAVHQPQPRPRHPRHRQGRHLPDGDAAGVPADGDFDVAEALKHADGDAELSENFKQLNGSDDNFRGFPSSMVEGTYDLNGQRMQSYNRVVVATGTPVRPNLPGQQYLIQLTVTELRRPGRRRRDPTSRPSSRDSWSGPNSRRQRQPRDRWTVRSDTRLSAMSELDRRRPPLLRRPHRHRDRRQQRTRRGHRA